MAPALRVSSSVRVLDQVQNWRGNLKEIAADPLDESTKSQ
jgi:hypothetical protein